MAAQLWRTSGRRPPLEGAASSRIAWPRIAAVCRALAPGCSPRLDRGTSHGPTSCLAGLAHVVRRNLGPARGHRLRAREAARAAADDDHIIVKTMILREAVALVADAIGAFSGVWKEINERCAQATRVVAAGLNRTSRRPPSGKLMARTCGTGPWRRSASSGAGRRACLGTYRGPATRRAGPRSPPGRARIPGAVATPLA